MSFRNKLSSLSLLALVVAFSPQAKAVELEQCKLEKRIGNKVIATEAGSCFQIREKAARLNPRGGINNRVSLEVYQVQVPTVSDMDNLRVKIDQQLQAERSQRDELQKKLEAKVETETQQMETKILEALSTTNRSILYKEVLENLKDDIRAIVREEIKKSKE